MILNKDDLISKVCIALNSQVWQLQIDLRDGLRVNEAQLATAINKFVQYGFEVAIKEMYSMNDFEKDLGLTK